MSGPTPTHIGVEPPSRHPVPPKHGQRASGKSDIGPPKYDNFYVTLRGYGPGDARQLSVLCGDAPPTITDGYAKWSVVDRPLRTGVTTFQGYNPAKMSVSLRFGNWSGFGTGEGGWDMSESAADQLERDISTLEWMAGASFGAGAPPYVYVNTYGGQGGTTNLIPYSYQETVGAGKYVTDTKHWPWIIDGGIQWGTSHRSYGGSRIYQECSFNLTNYQSFSPPPQGTKRGAYFKTTPHYHDLALIAGAPSSHALDVQRLAYLIRDAPLNNPVKRHKHLHLKSVGIRGRLKPGLEIWVPSHVI